MKQPSIAEQEMGWCVHFNGTQQEICKAGVRYDALVPEPFGRSLRLPCFSGASSIGQRRTEPPVACEHVRFPTREEAEQHEREALERLRQRSEAIKRGECPNHKRKVALRQVGACGYGDCGCRLYQGKLPKPAQADREGR